MGANKLLLKWHLLPFKSMGEGEVVGSIATKCVCNFPIINEWYAVEILCSKLYMVNYLQYSSLQE